MKKMRNFKLKTLHTEKAEFKEVNEETVIVINFTKLLNDLEYFEVDRPLSLSFLKQYVVKDDKIKIKNWNIYYQWFKDKEGILKLAFFDTNKKLLTEIKKPETISHPKELNSPDCDDINTLLGHLNLLNKVKILTKESFLAQADNGKNKKYNRINNLYLV